MTDDDQPTLDGTPAPPFEAPLPAADVRRCPACLSPVRADQRYCLECGERLTVDEIPPPPGGGSALAERGSTALVVAAVVLVLVGVGLSWLALREPGDDGAAQTTATATTDTVATDTMPTDTVPTDTVITDTVMTDTGTTPTGDWPLDLTAWAVIIASKEQGRFSELDARVIADEAAAAGVLQTGVLDSSAYASLNPGYWAVYSGPYATQDEAEDAAVIIRTQGYPEAYAREVAP
ncbi:MAG: hypothetical protein ACO3KD_02395 [Gaiellales bacterium]